MSSKGLQLADTIGAITCDTGGTVFDWYSGVERALAETGRMLGRTADWSEFCREWRRRSTGMVNDGLPQAGGRATMDMDDVLRSTLDQVIAEYDLGDMSEHTRSKLVKAWAMLDAWEDVKSGLPRLREKFIVAPFTILKTELVILASRRSKLSWDCVVSCEMIGTYKTHPLSYATAAQWLGVQPRNILMVTTHNNDLRAAHACGFATAFVYRPREWGSQASPDPDPDPVADMVCKDFDDLADQLGCPTTGELGSNLFRVFTGSAGGAT